MFSKKEQWVIFCTVNTLVLLAAVLFPYYKAIASVIPIGDCGMLRYLRLYCPACGGTRAFGALLSFDLLGSLYYNPIVPVGACLFAAYEIGMIKHLIRGKSRPTLIKLPLVLGVLGAWIAFFAVRNVLLLCGFDMLGDVLA